jgi:hypothetical protein
LEDKNLADDTLRFVKFDYASNLDAIIQRIRARYPSVWNDFQTGNFGRMFLDVVAFTTATTAYAINRAAAENFLSTMTLRESAIRVGSEVSYRLRGPAPSTVSCDATLFSAAAADVLISSGTPLRTADNVFPFEVDKDYTILVGNTTPIQTIVRFDPSLSGSGVLQTLVQVYAGQDYVDILDTSIPVNEYLSVGQLFRQTGPVGPEYKIQGISAAPNSSNQNRLALSQAWSGIDGAITAEVIDRTITVVQGQTVVEQFVTPSQENPGYTVKLGQTSVIDNSIVMTINGVEWSQVPSLLFYGDTDNVYEATTLPSGSTVVEFGDGKFGVVPATNATLEIAYRVGGGADSNIATGAINTTIVGLIPSLSNPINITVINNLPGSGGLDAETLDEARANIPAYARANDRAVTQDDYQTIASNFSDPKYGQVRYARAYTRAENDFLERNIVVVSAWTSGVNGSLTPVGGALKATLLDYLQSKAVGTDYVILSDGTTRPIPISIRFKVLPGADVNDTTDSVLAAIKDSVAQLRPGAPLIFSNFIRLIDEVENVDTVNIATPTSDLYPSNQYELFTPPDTAYSYELSIQSSSSEQNSYSSTLPVFPLAPWAFQLFMGGVKLEILPGVKPGSAKVSGGNLSTQFESSVDLLSGGVTLSVDGVPGTLTMCLNTALGYSRERNISIYVGYSADGDSQLKRRQIRAALKSWISGFAPGSSIFASKQVNVAASASNVTDVVLGVDGVVSVTRVSFDTANNPSARLDLGATEIALFANIFLNSISD